MALKQMTWSLIASVLAVGQASAQPAKAPEFLFPQDRNLRPLLQSPEIEPGAPLSSSPSLSAPLTRLDYILWQAEARLNSSSAFEDVAGQPLVGGASFDVGYSEVLQRAFVGVNISLPSRPVRPMTETCRAAISRFDSLLLLRFRVGDRYNNWPLGILKGREGEPEAMDFLAKSVVYTATVSALYGTASDGGFFQVHCYSTGGDTPILMYGESMPPITFRSP